MYSIAYKTRYDLSQSATNFSDIHNRFIKKNEFPDGVIDWLHSDVIQQLESFRRALPSDCYFTPSPLPTAHIRQTGNSQHSINSNQQLSVATDIFVPAKYWWKVYCLASRYFNGIGFYLDMVQNRKNTPMFHFDLREFPVIWTHGDEEYKYTAKQIAKDLLKASLKW